MPRNEDELTLDTWTALLAGAAPWWNRDEPGETWQRLLSFGVLVIAATSSTTVLAGTDTQLQDQFIVVGVLLGSIALLCVNPILILVHYPPFVRGVWINLIGRVALLMSVWLSVYIMLPGWRALWSTPIAAAVGVDVLMTCNSLGWSPMTQTWYRKFLTSPFHLGVVGAMCAIFVGSQRHSLGAVQIFVCVHCWAAAAALTLWVVGSLQDAERGENARAIREVIAAERRERAHWIHDDVCAQLRLVSLRLQTEDVRREDVVALLADFDHQLRLRQLDELLESGRVRVGEVLQPFIRYAQSHGVSIEGVPAFEQAALALPDSSGRLAARAASVLTSNSLNAGSTSIAFEVLSTQRSLELTLTDNGPGFTLDSVPAGRGLWTLMDQLGPGSLRVEPRQGGGSTVTASIRIDSEADNVNNSPS